MLLDKYPMGVYILDTPTGYTRKGEKKMDNNCCCHAEEKTTVRPDEQKKKLLNRLKRIEGQVRGLQTMIEKDAYCNDILTQASAISAALNSFNKEILASHIHGCVARDIKAGNDEVIDELVTTLHKLMK